MTFTIDPEVRRIRYHDPDSLSLEEYFFEYYYSPTILLRETGEPFVEYLRRNTRILRWLDPGERFRCDVDLEQGYLVGSPRLLVKCLPDATGGPDPGGILAFELAEGRLEPSPVEVAPGAYSLEIHNIMDRPHRVCLHFATDVEYFDYRPFLSGKRLLCTHSFRSLFRTEVVDASRGIPVNDITLVFSDLINSTDLYAQLGDRGAFNVVSQQFEFQARAIARSSGAIVKTIGDAVMASFSEPVSAVAAAVQIIQELTENQVEKPDSGIGIKIGIHRGSAIAVSCNNALDFFGKTVNISARVENLAGRDEICLTEEVYSAPEVQALLAGHEVIKEAGVSLKGVGESMPIYRVVFGS